MAITAISGAENVAIILLLSTDSKPNPNNASDSWTAIECDTGQVYYNNAGTWKLASYSDATAPPIANTLMRMGS